MKILQTLFKKSRYGTRDLLTVVQTATNDNCAEKQAQETTKLEFGSWKGMKDGKTFCGITVSTEYAYESGRSSTQYTSVRLPSSKYRELAAHLLELADITDKENE